MQVGVVQVRVVQVEVLEMGVVLVGGLDLAVRVEGMEGGRGLVAAILAVIASTAVVAGGVQV